MTGAVFLDRDGTINVRKRDGYVLCPEEFHFLPGALEALAALAQGTEQRIVVVTNQSAINRGLMFRSTLEEIHMWMRQGIRYAGGRLDGIYVCPHRPEDGCLCRKPRPALLIQAAHELGIDLSKSSMIGDAGTDLRAAWAAGIPEEQTYLVLTGYAGAGKYPSSLGYERKYKIMGMLGDAVGMILKA